MRLSLYLPDHIDSSVVAGLLSKNFGGCTRWSATGSWLYEGTLENEPVIVYECISFLPSNSVDNILRTYVFPTIEVLYVAAGKRQQVLFGSIDGVPVPWDCKP